MSYKNVPEKENLMTKIKNLYDLLRFYFACDRAVFIGVHNIRDEQFFFTGHLYRMTPKDASRVMKLSCERVIPEIGEDAFFSGEKS